MQILRKVHHDACSKMEALHEYVLKFRVRTGVHLPARMGFEAEFGKSGNREYEYANCYRYAIGIAGTRWIDPGSLNKMKKRALAGAQQTIHTEIRPRRLHALIQQDGFVPIHQHGEDPSVSQVFACFADKDGRDYHFFRMHTDCTWSHKQGSKIPSAYDNSKKPIGDLNQADLGNYTDFVGFYKVPEEGVVYKF